jgi:phosphoserine phosphatase
LRYRYNPGKRLRPLTMPTPTDAPASDLVIQAPDIETPSLKALARLSGAEDITALDGGGMQAFRLSRAANHAGVEAFCAQESLDFAFVPRDQGLGRVRLVAMDMDSTLITIECIDELADVCGIKPQVAGITADAMRGEIDFHESLTRRVAFLAGLETAALQRVYDERLRLSPGAERMLAGFKRAGAKTLLVSGGFTFFTDRLKLRLGLDDTVANTLEIVDGKLTGRILGDIVDGNAKAAAFARLAGELRGQEGLVVAIGDGANDLPMLARADVSIAYHAKPVVREKTTYRIDYCGLDAALNLFV